MGKMGFIVGTFNVDNSYIGITDESLANQWVITPTPVYPTWTTSNTHATWNICPA